MKKIDFQQAASKVKSLNLLLQNLMQKKIRIDLEIKRTKMKLSNFKKFSEVSLKSSLQIEESTFPYFTSIDDAKNHCQEIGVDFEATRELDEALDEAKELLSIYEEQFSQYIIEENDE